MLKRLLPVAVVLLAVAIAVFVRARAPEPERRSSQASVPTVQVSRVASSDHPVVLDSRGRVRPAVSTRLVSEVSGVIESIGKAFVVGGAFEAGELLVEIDDRDYRIALTQARASLAGAKAALEQQRAEADRARAEWDSLGRRGEPSSLTLRKPQLAAARADLAAARAGVERAELDLERTRILAPYAGRVQARDVDVGEFVSRGNPLGQVHGAATVEIPLSLTDRQRRWLSMPAPVEIVATGEASRDIAVSGSERRDPAPGRWQGRVVRSEGIDADTQLTRVVAEVEAPFADPARPLSIGQFVSARIQGRVLESVVVIPRRALRQNRHVLVLADDDTVSRRAVQALWFEDQDVVIGEGLVAGEVIVTSALDVVADGTPVVPLFEGKEATDAPRREAGRRDRDATPAERPAGES